MPLNLYGDISALALTVQDDAIFVLREQAQMQNLIRRFDDRTGMNTRTGHVYNQSTAVAVVDSDDLTSHAFTPATDQVLTPAEIALQFFISDQRAETDAPENILSDAASELGLAASDKVESDLVGDMASLTGGTIGAAGTIITWGYVAAAIGQAYNANKSTTARLSVVVHAYQWAVLAKSASIAGATVAVAPGVQEQVTRTGLLGTFMNQPIYQVFAAADTNGDFTGGVFPRDALAIDWRRAIRVRPERDESRRGVELNMSGIYGHGVWRPTRGIKMIFDAAAPTS